MAAQTQLIAAGLLVVLAALYVARAVWGAFAGAGKGCGSGCGKCAAPPAGGERKGLIALDQVPPRPAGR